MKIFFLLVLVIHGLIHLLGFLKAFIPALPTQLKGEITKPIGVIWEMTSSFFLMTAVFYFLNLEWWWAFGCVAVIASQILIFLSWSDAKFGTIINLLLIFPIVMSFANSQPSSYKNIFAAEVKKGLLRSSTQEFLTEQDIKSLPIPVQKYLVYSGSVGKKRVQSLKVVCIGGIKPKPDSDFLDFKSVQYDFFDEPERLFFLESKMFGLPFDGLHMYVGPAATMQIKVASLFQVVDAKGPEMNKGETVTMFNDMCFFAPATLISEKIKWETVDSLTVKAKFTNHNNIISATLFFNSEGALIDFASDDRYQSSDGKVYKNFRWTTPVKNYKDFNGRKIASYGEAIWHESGRNFCYGKFNIVEVEYNLKKEL